MIIENADAIADERIRIEREYRRREKEVAANLYAPWQPSESFTVSERKNTAAYLLHKAGKFPKAGDKCLEVGYGKIGWLADLISWGLRENDLHGIELDSIRAKVAQDALPNADLQIGDASRMQWEDNSFDTIIVSTVFSSILNLEVRESVSREIIRVLKPGGVLLWYDLAVNNPRNPNVQGIGAKELKKLFAPLEGTIKRVTLAPPIARLIAPKSFALAAIFNTLPFLRTHLLGVLVKK